MQIVKRIPEIKAYIEKVKKEGKKVGLVPTMGFFHEGHLELMRQAKKECDIVVVSLFVNPTQFGPGEDFEDYPRDIKKDFGLAKSVGVDVIFTPEAKEMYPDGFSTFVNVEEITEKLCGKSRPGHFRGVATVVLKLFNIVKPDFAYFGQKDAQQVLVIERMVRDLNVDVKIHTVPIVREADGLAKSSRNLYLSPAERKAATILYKALKETEKKIKAGERDIIKLKENAKKIIDSEPLAKIDYLEILSVPDLNENDTLQGKMLFALAVKIGKARLIDNMLLGVE